MTMYPSFAREWDGDLPTSPMSPMISPTVELRDVTFAYPQFTLGPITLSLGSGSRCALVGRNGAGKTTLLGVLAGQRATSAGSYRFLGVERSAPDVTVKDRVAFVTPDALGCPWMTVRQHLSFLANFYERWDSDGALSLADAMQLPLDKTLQSLSRGNAVKAALCSAWGQQADLLLLDEPTAGLDPVARAELLQQLASYLADRPAVSMVFATHVLEDLDSLELTDLLALREGLGRCERIRSGDRGNVSARARRFLLEPA
jgi:ABC-2 type transport system ATP-binding protein